MYSVKLPAPDSHNKASMLTMGQRSITRIAAVGTIGLMLTGCAAWQKDQTSTGAVPDDYRARHPIVVTDDESVQDLAISAKKRNLSLRDRNVIKDFAFRFKNSGAKYMRMILPVGSPNERAAVKVSTQVAEEIYDVGVPAGSVQLATYHAADHGDAATIRLSYHTLKASVQSQCGVWDSNLFNTTANRNYSNFGCATQSNLAAMVANPADLIGPRGVSEIDATRRNEVITVWREEGSGTLPELLAGDE